MVLQACHRSRKEKSPRLRNPPGSSVAHLCSTRLLSSALGNNLSKGCGPQFILKSPIRYARRAFGAHSRYVMSPFAFKTKPNFSLPLLNFSKPPSVSLMVCIHFWAWANLLRRASLKGESQGSSCTTPSNFSLVEDQRRHISHLCHPLVCRCPLCLLKWSYRILDSTLMSFWLGSARASSTCEDSMIPNKSFTVHGTQTIKALLGIIDFAGMLDLVAGLLSLPGQKQALRRQKELPRIPSSCIFRTKVGADLI